MGATVVHEVDARKMKDHPLLKWRQFDFFVYNFPHAGFYGTEDNPAMIKYDHLFSLFYPKLILSFLFHIFKFSCHLIGLDVTTLKLWIGLLDEL